MATYRMISECIASGISMLGVPVRVERGTVCKSDLARKPCFISTSRYEIAHRGRKVAGSAQKAGRTTVLQHGSIPLGPGYLGVVDYVACGPEDRRRLRMGMGATTCCLSELIGSHHPPEQVAAALARGLAERFDLMSSGCSAELFSREIVDKST
jgi:lipoate-protein ligase A